MEIYKCPEYLIIHFKRFSHQKASFFGTKKINDLIDFPLTGLDLTHFVLDKENN